MSPGLRFGTGSDFSRVFLSSTVRDFAAYRREVKEVLDKEAEVAVFLSEDWAGGYDDTLARCLLEINEAHGFFLMLGHWYGSIPPGHDKSITQLEFDWAMEKWGDRDSPPMAVLQPEPGSQADRELLDAAEVLLSANENSSRTEHAKLLDAFRALVVSPSDRWRTVKQFRDKQELRERTLSSCWEWKGRTLVAAARGDVQVDHGTRLTDEQLGSLGRQHQVDVATDVLTELFANPEVPAVCLLVSGMEDAGQRAFLAHMLTTDAFSCSRPSRPGRPPMDHYDLGTLTSWMAKAMGLGKGVEDKSPEGLADLAAKALRGQPIHFALDQVNRFTGGVAAFSDLYWKPFARRLGELHACDPLPHHLIGVAADYTGDLAGLDSPSQEPGPAAAAADAGRLVLLPPLADFTRLDVLKWLTVHGVRNRPADRHARLAESVLRDGKGEPDPTPLRVFERLKGQNLWPDEEQNE